MKDTENTEEKNGFLEKGNTAVKKWLGMYIKDGKITSDVTGKILSEVKDGISGFLTAFVFSRAESFGQTLPYGLALLAGSRKRVPYILLGVLAGGMGREDSGIYTVCAMLVFTLRLIVGYVLEGKRSRVFTEPVPMRMAFGSCAGFVSGIYRIFDGGFKEAQLYEAFFLITVIPLFSYIFSYTESKRSNAENDSKYLSIFSFITYFVLVKGLRSFDLYTVSPAIAVCSAVAMATALKCGSTKGALAGMTGGVSLGGIENTVILGIVGAVCGSLRKKNASASIGASCAIGTAISLLYGGGVTIISDAPSIALGGLLSLSAVKVGLLSKLSVLDGVTEVSGARSGDVILTNNREEEMNSRLNSLSEALTSLSGVFYDLSNRLGSPQNHKVREICVNSFKKYCKKCPQNTYCWVKNYERTADILNKLSNSVMRNGCADSSYIPSDFLSTCPNTVKALSELNITHARLLESAARQNKTEVFALDYEAMAKLLSEASEQNSSEYDIDNELSRRVRTEAKKMDMGFNSMAVYGNRRKTIVAGGVELEHMSVNSTEIRERLEKACGVKLNPPEFKYDDGYVTMTASAKNIFKAESAKASLKKKDEQVSGDSALTFENREDKYYALISDGMGSGTEASMTSSIAGIFLEKLLGAGNRKNTVLKMLNNFIRHKNLECFATVDLFEIDLLTGESSFVKSGAAASYVLRDGRVFKIASKSLPIGITREMNSEEIKFPVHEGDIIVMMSDGISQSFEDGAWLLSELSSLDPSKSIGEISSMILDKALDKNGRNDDMTVLTVKVLSA